MKITLGQIRRIINEEISLLRESGESDPPAPDIGRQLKGSAASEKAIQKIEDNSAIKAAIDQIETADKLAAFMQRILSLASEKGIERGEVLQALNKLGTAVRTRTPNQTQNR